VDCAINGVTKPPPPTEPPPPPKPKPELVPTLNGEEIDKDTAREREQRVAEGSAYDRTNEAMRYVQYEWKWRL
jgi:hypothetical protein